MRVLGSLFLSSRYHIYLSCWLLGLVLSASHSVWAVPTGMTDGTQASTLNAMLKGRKIGLVIGINRYKDPHWYPLQFATRDARRFHAMMIQGGFSKQHTYLLTSSRQTTLASIRKAIQRLKRVNQNRYDTVVIYISAHGTIVSRGHRQTGKRYIITSDTNDENITGTGLKVEVLRELVKAFPSRRKAIVLATCYTGKPASKSRLPRGQKGAVLSSPAPYSKTMLILNAASYGYSAYESKQLKSDVYTHFLLACISRFRKRSGGNGRVSATQAHSCAVRKTYRYVMKFRKVRQLPGLEADVTGLDAVYLVGKASLSVKRGSNRGVAQTTKLVSKGVQPLVQIRLQVLERFRVHFSPISKGPNKRPRLTYDAPADLLTSLKPGRYRVTFERRKKGGSYSRTVALAQGARVMLEPPSLPRRRFLSVSVGAAQAGSQLLEATYASFSLHYRQWIWGIGLTWDGFGQPLGTRFRLHKVAVRAELGYPWSFAENVGLFVGAFLSPGSILRQSSEGTLSAGFFLQTGGTLSFYWWFLSRVGLQLSGDFGLDFTPTLQNSWGLSFAWRVNTSVLFAF